MPGLTTTPSVRRNTSEVLDVVTRTLEPYIGRLMARTAPAAHCNDLGIHDAQIAGPQIDALLEKLGLALVIFLGRDKAGTVVDDMRKAVLTLDEKRP